MITPDDWEDAKIVDKEFADLVKRWLKRGGKRKIKWSVLLWAMTRNSVLACLELIDEKELLEGIYTIIDCKKNRKDG